MASDLPLHLKKLEVLPSALDIIRFLADGAADLDDICDGLDISERRFRKATRRLVTTGYVQMGTDGVYELTSKGNNAVRDLSGYDSQAPTEDETDESPQRRLVLALPRTLIAGQAAPLHVGFPTDASGNFEPPLDLVLRLTSTYANLSSSGDKLISLGQPAYTDQITITAQPYTQVRLKVQVFQLLPGGEDISVCGGFYVDVDVADQGESGPLVAYGLDMSFTVD